MNEQIADTVRWFQQRIDMLEAQINAMSVAIVEARNPVRHERKSFRGMGHRREHQDRCENCGLTGQAFAVAEQKGQAIECPLAQIDGDGCASDV